MNSSRKVAADLNSVKQIRSISRAGGSMPRQFTTTGKILVGVVAVCVIGGVAAAMVVSLRSATPTVGSEDSATTVSTTTISITINISTTTTSTTTTAPIELSYRGVYIDGFNSILGNNNTENLLLRWCVKNNFNAISLYDLNTIMATASRWTNLAQFIKKARVSYGIRQVSAIRSLSTQFIQNAAYDANRTDPYERFTTYNLELEWWNSCTGCNFSTYTPVLDTMTALAKNATPTITTETYIGYFRNPAGQDLTQANTLVRMLDRIMVHDYQTSPSFGYMLNRTSYLAEAAYSQNRTVDLVVIFSAEASFMYNYFDVNGQNHTFYDAYQEILNQFNATSFNYKTNVQLIGYQIFAYNNASSARPFLESLNRKDFVNEETQCTQLVRTEIDLITMDIASLQSPFSYRDIYSNSKNSTAFLHPMCLKDNLFRNKALVFLRKRQHLYFYHVSKLLGKVSKKPIYQDLI